MYLRGRDRMKKVISIVLVLVLATGCLAGSVCAAGASFTDVKESDYFYNPVQWAVENGVTSGMGDNRFGPLHPCTRGQVVTFLWRAAGSPSPSSNSNPFADVDTDDYFYTPVLWAVENGITAGVGANRFGPNQTCTRAQIVTFLWKSKNAPEPSNPNVGFSDVGVSAYYAKPVAWAVENGVTAGMGNNRFAPEATCTRGQVMTFLYKAKNTAPGAPETEDNSQLTMAKEVFNLVNAERQKAGLTPLAYYEAGQPAVDIRCDELKVQFSHTRPNGSSCFTVLEELGLRVWSCGENIAWGQRSPEEVMQDWMNSEGHRANILNPNFTGLAVATDDGYWVQMFVAEG